MFESTREITNKNSNEQNASPPELVTLDGVPCSLGIWGITEELDLTILHELDYSFVNQVLNLIFQRPTAVSVMLRTVGVVCTPYIRIVMGRRSIGILRRFLQCNQLGLQHML